MNITQRLSLLEKKVGITPTNKIPVRKNLKENSLNSLSYPGGKMELISSSTSGDPRVTDDREEMPEGYGAFATSFRVPPSVARIFEEDFPGSTMTRGCASITYNTTWDEDKPYRVEIWLTLEFDNPDLNSFEPGEDAIAFEANDEFSFEDLESAILFVKKNLKNPFKKFCNFSVMGVSGRLKSY